MELENWYTEDEELQLLSLVRHPWREIWMRWIEKRERLPRDSIQNYLANPLLERENVYDIISLQSAVLNELRELKGGIELISKKGTMEKELADEESRIEQQVKNMEGI